MSDLTGAGTAFSSGGSINIKAMREQLACGHPAMARALCSVKGQPMARWIGLATIASF